MSVSPYRDFRSRQMRGVHCRNKLELHGCAVIEAIIGKANQTAI
jgi:hypothetical protein